MFFFQQPHKNDLKCLNHYDLHVTPKQKGWNFFCRATAPVSATKSSQSLAESDEEPRPQVANPTKVFPLVASSKHYTVPQKFNMSIPKNVHILKWSPPVPKAHHFGALQPLDFRHHFWTKNDDADLPDVPPQPQQMPLLWPYFSSVSMVKDAVARLTGCPPLDQPARNILVSSKIRIGQKSPR